MRIKVNGNEILIPKKVLVQISKKYNPRDYLYVADFGICIMLVYEESFHELDLLMYGYVIYPFYPPAIRYGGFQTMKEDYRHFTIEEKRKAIEYYLGIEPESNTQVEKLFDELIWLKKETQEDIEIPDDLLF